MAGQTLAWMSVLALLLALAFDTVTAQENTFGKTIEGYAFNVNVYSYRELSKQIDKVMNAMNANKPADAKKFYEQTTLSNWNPRRSLKIFATADEVSRFGSRTSTGEPFHKMYAKFFGSQYYLHDFVKNFDDKIKVEVGCLWIVYALCANQMDRTTMWLKQGPDAFKRAVDEVDDTWGAYIGYPGYPSLLKLHADVATKGKRCAGKTINEQIPPLLTRMRDAARKKDFAGIKKEYDQFWRLQITGLLRAVLWRTGLQTKGSQKRAAYYIRMMQPQLTDTNTAKALYTQLTGANIIKLADVTASVTKIAQAQGLVVTSVVC